MPTVSLERRRPLFAEWKIYVIGPTNPAPLKGLTMTTNCDTLSLAEVGKKLGRSRSWIYDHLDELKRLGLPDPLPIINRFHSAAIDAWLERIGMRSSAAKEHTEARELDAAFGL
jgi:predicted DNA-binding transcriptional regulator AlpA